MSMRHSSSNPQPHPAVLPHLRRFETPDMAQSGGCPQEALGIGWDTAADRWLHLTLRTEDLAWPGTQKIDVADGRGSSRNNMCAVYPITKKMTGGLKSSTGTIKWKDDIMPSKGEDKRARRAERFKEVLSRPQPAWLTSSHRHAVTLLPADTSDCTEDNRFADFDRINEQMMTISSSSSSSSSSWKQQQQQQHP